MLMKLGEDRGGPPKADMGERLSPINRRQIGPYCDSTLVPAFHFAFPSLTIPGDRDSLFDMTDNTNPLRLSDTAVLLLAANLTSVPQLDSLRALIAGYPDVLHFTAVLELLLKILPETISPEDYVSVVYRSYRRENERFDPSRIPASFIDEVLTLSPASIRRKLAVFNLSNPPKSSPNTETDEKLLAQWFFDRARRVEEATGMIDLARRLVLPDPTPFHQTPPFPPLCIIVWGRGIIKVLETFIFDNDDEDELQLLPFENLDPDSAVRLLLSRTSAETVSRNIRNLIVPFADYINFQNQGKEIWTTVWDWLLDRTTAGELEYVANLTNDWIETSNDLSKDFLQTCLAACYLCHKSSPTIRADLHRIHNNITNISQRLHIQHSDDQITLAHPETDLLATQLRKSSPLTALTTSSLRFLDDMICSADIFAQYSITPELALREIISIREGSEEPQRQLADRLLRSDQSWAKRNEEQWRRLRQSMKWLQGQSRVLGKIPEVSLDTMILTTILDASAFGLARDIFVRTNALPADVLEKTILEVFYRFYDNATNGNRTRGGMKNAFQTLHVLDDPSTTTSTSHAVKLVTATHALSNYSLTITPGVPITPAQIRMNKDPALLISKVIEGNPPIYREGERMIKILNDLIDGTQLFSQAPNTRELETSRMQARVNATIVKAALADDDFTIAYDTCMNKLSPLTSTYASDTPISEAAWIAFYQTGVHSGRTSTRSSAKPSTSSTSVIDGQKMELLARAMLICPKEEIEGILNHWTYLENKILHPELAQPPQSEQTSRSSGEHRSIFATAAQIGRSVARSATPLTAGRDGRNGSAELGRERTAGESSAWGSSTSRFGVRDTVKSGLTQGIGWLLGATPTQNTDNHTGEHK